MNKQIHKRALTKNVLAVAVINLDDQNKIFDWSCYVGVVSGVNHEHEKQEVALSGGKQCRTFAEILFPHLDITCYRD